MVEELESDGQRPQRGWPRAAGLFGVVLAVPVVHPGVLMAVPLLLLFAARGFKGLGAIVAMVLAGLVVLSGSRDGIWFAERAWAVLVGGWFLALTMLVPQWRLSERALGAVVGAGVVGAGALAARADAWAALDEAVSSGIRAGVEATLDGWVLLRGGESFSPALMEAFREAAEAQASVFPALVLLESMAALGVVWWARTRLVGEGDQGLGPLREFRFNDHLVWVFVAGMLLLVAQFGDALVRVGSNAVVFMGALYAMRGAAVVMFVTGGWSLFGLVMLVLGIVLAAPVVLGLAVLVGVGDTWLDLRERAQRTA